MNDYEQFGDVAFVSRPTARDKLTGVQIARAPARWLSDCCCVGLSVRQGKR